MASAVQGTRHEKLVRDLNLEKKEPEYAMHYGRGDGDLDGLLASVGPGVGVPDGDGEGTGS